MQSFVTLDEVAHSDLRVANEPANSPDAHVNQTLALPTEFLQLAREYPIFFRKDDSGNFFAIVLLGLDRNENLYLQNGHWQARYVPAVIERGPFGLAFPSGTGATEQGQEPTLKIDLNDQRVSTESGQRLFRMHGGRAPYLEAVMKVLQRIHIGTSMVGAFFEELTAHNLIEPITLEAKISDEFQYTLPDLYTIGRKPLADLGPEQLHKLNALGLLEHCFAIISSVENFAKIVDLKAVKKNGQ